MYIILHIISYILFSYSIFRILKMSTGILYYCVKGTIVMEDREFGYIKIKLDELIKAKGISKNKLSQRAEMQRTQINRYCNNQVTRMDTATLSRICSVLECKIEDLLEYVPDAPK